MEKYIEQLKPLFSDIASKIGESAEFGWEIVLRQQMVEGVLSIVMGAFGLVLAFLTYKAVVYGIKKQEKDFYSDWGFISTIVGFTGGGASLVLIVEGFSDGVLRLMNPSYYALQFFMDLIK